MSIYSEELDRRPPPRDVLGEPPARFHPVPIGQEFNNSAITTADRIGDGGMNVWGNSLPAGTMPDGEELVHGVPFFCTGAGTAVDNVRCAGQLFVTPPAATDWVHLLAAAERRTEDVVQMHYADASCDAEWLRVSDFWPSAAHFGELPAFRSERMHYPHHVQPGLGGQIWLARVPAVRRTPLSAVRLPDNPAIHVFAMTLERSR